MWTRETKSDVSQLKAEPTNGQSGKLSLNRGWTGEHSKDSTTILLTWWKKSEDKKEKRKRSEWREKRKKGVEEKVKKRRVRKK